MSFEIYEYRMLWIAVVICLVIVVPFTYYVLSGGYKRRDRARLVKAVIVGVIIAAFIEFLSSFFVVVSDNQSMRNTQERMTFSGLETVESDAEAEERRSIEKKQKEQYENEKFKSDMEHQQEMSDKFLKSIQ